MSTFYVFFYFRSAIIALYYDIPTYSVKKILVLGRLPKPEPKPQFFGKTEPKRNRGFRRPNGRFGFGGSAYMVLVTVKSVCYRPIVIFSIIYKVQDVGLAALKTAVKAHLQNCCKWRRAGSMNESRQSL